MYHKLGLFEYFQKNQSGKWTKNIKINAFFLSKFEQTRSPFDQVNQHIQVRHNISRLCLWDYKPLGVDIFEELFKPWIIDTDEVVNMA